MIMIGIEIEIGSSNRNNCLLVNHFDSDFDWLMSLRSVRYRLANVASLGTTMCLTVPLWSAWISPKLMNQFDVIYSLVGHSLLSSLPSVEWMLRLHAQMMESLGGMVALHRPIRNGSGARWVGLSALISLMFIFPGALLQAGM